MFTKRRTNVDATSQRRIDVYVLSRNMKNIRAQLFKANDVVSLRFVKIYIEWYANMLKFFAEKMWVAFAVQKLLTFFSKKYQNIVYWIR